MLYRQMQPSIQLSWTKRFHRAKKKKAVAWRKSAGLEDGSGLQFSKFGLLLAIRDSAFQFAATRLKLLLLF